MYKDVMMDLLDELRKEQAAEKAMQTEEGRRKAAQEIEDIRAAAAAQRQEMEARIEAERLRRQALREHFLPSKEVTPIVESTVTPEDSMQVPVESPKPVPQAAPVKRGIGKYVVGGLLFLGIGAAALRPEHEPIPQEPAMPAVVTVVTAPPSVKIEELKAVPPPPTSPPTVASAAPVIKVAQPKARKVAPVVTKIQVDLSAE